MMLLEDCNLSSTLSTNHQNKRYLMSTIYLLVLLLCFVLCISAVELTGDRSTWGLSDKKAVIQGRRGAWGDSFVLSEKRAVIQGRRGAWGDSLVLSDRKAVIQGRKGAWGDSSVLSEKRAVIQGRRGAWGDSE
jgi:hypothetical protein